MNLKIAAICKLSTTHGPGARYTIWVQGCDKRCPGCISPEWQAMTGGLDMDVAKLAHDIVSRPHLAGVTISGGEPLLQSAPLAHLLGMVTNARPDMNVILYTGYTMGQVVLGGVPDMHRVLSMCDVVIDGPYVATLNDDRGIRGSSNQTFHYLTERLRPYKTEMETAARRVTIYTAKDKYFLSGVPPMGMEGL